jgi:4-amino-4-deoxy-L-arabinose transferase-like glycosyltransferase
VGAALWLLAFCIFLLGNNGHSLWDRDEPRYSVATREMLESGDWVIPRFNGQIRYDKPVLVYWCMSLPMKLLGPTEFAARFHAALAGSLTVLLLYVFALRLGGSFCGALMAGLGAIFIAPLFVVSKAATTDALLTLSVVAAMLMYWENRHRPFSWLKHLAFWAILALSGLLKGPVGIGVVALAIMCDRIWEYLGAGRWQGREGYVRLPLKAAPPREIVLRWAAGIAVFLVVAMPWIVAAWLRTDGEFITHSLKVHVVDRAVGSAKEGHEGPFFYYVALLPLLLLPLTAFALTASRWSWRNIRRPQNRLLWSWILPGMIMFSIAKTKLPHYTTPLLPAFCLMIGLWWGDLETRLREGAERLTAEPAPVWWRVGAVFMALVGALAMLAIPVGLVFWHLRLVDEGVKLELAAAFVCLMAALGGGMLAGAHYWWRMRPPQAAKWILTSMACAYIILLTWGLPSLEPLRPTRQIGEFIRERAPVGTEMLALIYQEDSLVFYARRPMTKLAWVDHEGGFARLAETSRPAALVTEKDRWERWKKRYGEDRIPSQIGVRHEGRYYDFQKGGWKNLVVVGNWTNAAPTE